MVSKIAKEDHQNQGKIKRLRISHFEMELSIKLLRS
jgi:hypothetical protein